MNGTYPRTKKIVAIIPAYNEERTISAVLHALKSSAVFSEIIVVDDGSSDRTADIAEQHGVVVLQQSNRGKGDAMRRGAEHADADILFFADADLLGFTGEHARCLVDPVQQGVVDMTVGIRDRGRIGMWLMEHVFPIIGGERAVSRAHFLRMTSHRAMKNFGIEIVMNAYCKRHHLTRRLIRMPGVLPLIKERKVGFLKGLFARIKMIGQIVKAEAMLVFDKTL